MEPSDLSVASVHRYPVKSMAGESPPAVDLGPGGVVGDRTWALRDTSTGRLVSAKRPRWYGRLLSCTAAGGGGDVAVTLPDGTVHAIDDPRLAEDLSALLGRPVVVERASGPGQGTYLSDWPELDGISLAGEIELPTNLGDGDGFVDVAAVHVVTTASLRRIAALAGPTASDVRRWRPTLVVDTGPAEGFIENGWTGRRLVAGDVQLELGDPTPRCIMVTLAQGDLPADPGILRALAAHNRVEGPLGTFACLGVYARVVVPGTVRAGDPVRWEG